MLYKYIIFLALTLAFVTPVRATTVKSYPVSDLVEFYGNPLLNKVFYTKSLSIPYKSGRVVISANPDGTGEAQVGEELMVVSGYPVNETFLRTNGCTGKMKPLDITHLMWTGSFQSNTYLTFQFRYNTCREFTTVDGITKQYAKVGPLYVVNFEEDQTITPFLDLPWDYKATNNIFSDMAYTMFSYFDHEYPLLSIGQMNEPIGVSKDILQYDGAHTTRPYSTHDGYDYSFQSNVILNTTVLAAASGEARYIDSCKSCGNAIIIDHKNRYQTRYYHLSSEGLITNISGQTIPVNDRQVIGKVGMTGNTDGPHIHFMVIHDKNGDGNFDDNIPDGIVDPYGWQSENPDPWPSYTFSFNGKESTGDSSYWLWKTKNQTVSKKISPSTNTSVTNGIYTAEFNKGFLVNDTIFNSNYVGVGTSDPKMQTITPGIDISLWDGIETYFTTFQKYFVLLTDFGKYDISRIIPETISLYSSTDGNIWQKENTTIDLTTKKATVSLNHLTKFVLMGEKMDPVPPVTETIFEGQKIENEKLPSYSLPVKITLTSTDFPAETSLGVEETFYKLNSQDWEKYTSPIELGVTGDYVLNYFSIDRDHNTEKHQEYHFAVKDEIQPEIRIRYDRQNNMYFITDIKGKKETSKAMNDEYTIYTFTDGTKHTVLTIKEKDVQNKRDIEIISIRYNYEPPIYISSMLQTKFSAQQMQWQMYNMDDRIHIKVEYPKKDTISIVKENDSKPNKIQGMKEIVLETNKGVINYHLE